MCERNPGGCVPVNSQNRSRLSSGDSSWRWSGSPVFLAGTTWYRAMRTRSLSRRRNGCHMLGPVEANGVEVLPGRHIRQRVGHTSRGAKYSRHNPLLLHPQPGSLAGAVCQGIVRRPSKTSDEELSAKRRFLTIACLHGRRAAPGQTRQYGSGPIPGIRDR
jgi:hypothetical protein